MYIEKEYEADFRPQLINFSDIMPGEIFVYDKQYYLKGFDSLGVFGIDIVSGRAQAFPQNPTVIMKPGAIINVGEQSCRTMDELRIIREEIEE